MSYDSSDFCLDFMDALKPFVALLQPHNERLPPNTPIFGINGALITVGHLKSARDVTEAYREAWEAENGEPL